MNGLSTPRGHTATAGRRSKRHRSEEETDFSGTVATRYRSFIQLLVNECLLMLFFSVCSTKKFVSAS